MIVKNSKNILFIINLFGTFGFLFSIFLLFFSWFDYVFNLNLNVYIGLVVGFILFYLILYFSLIFLREIVVFFPNLSIVFIKKSLCFLCFLYYFIVVVRFYYFDAYGIRVWLGFTTPLWIVSLLIIFDNLNKKILITSYFFIFLEMIIFYFIFLNQKVVGVKNISFLLSFFILLAFPFFLNFFNRYGVDLHINKSILKPLLILNSILGVFYIFYYYLLF